jgi:hypothetical protein
VREADRKRQAEERKARRAELKVAGLWIHPRYETLRAALADRWHRRRHGEVGGEEITLKGHTLVRNAAVVVPKPRERRFVYRTTLGKVYGLTPAMIDELGGPDEYRENPHWKTGPYPASLYSIERVEAWIEVNTGRVEKARESRTNRSVAAKRAHGKKRAERYEKAKSWVMSVPITLRRPFPDTLLAVAKSRPGRGVEAHVRHRFTNYESLLRVLYLHGFCEELYPLLRERIDPEVRAALAEWKNSQGNSGPNTAWERS